MKPVKPNPIIESFGPLAVYVLRVVKETPDKVMFAFRSSRRYNRGIVQAKENGLFDMVIYKEVRNARKNCVVYTDVTRETMVAKFEQETGVLCR